MPEESGGEAKVFTKSAEDQAAELEWLHKRGEHESAVEREARDVIAHYRERIPTLGAAIEGWEVSMQTMRDDVDRLNDEARNARRAEMLQEGKTEDQIDEELAATRGFLDAATRDAYLKTRKDLTDAHKETIALQSRIRNIAYPLPGTPEVDVSTELSDEAKDLMNQMEPDFSALEAAFGHAIKAHDEWRARNKNRLWGNRENEDTGEAKERPPLNREYYEARIAYLQSLAATLSADMESLTNPTSTDVAAMTARLRAMYEKMLEYERQKAGPFSSEKHADFLGTLKQLREQLKGLAQLSRRPKAGERMPTVESDERVNTHWDKLEKTLMPSVSAYEEIRKQVEDGRLKQEDLEEARSFMEAMYRRVREKILKLEDLTPSERVALEERARIRAHMTGEGLPVSDTHEDESAELKKVEQDNYSRGVRALMDRVGALVIEADDLEKQGKLTLQARQRLREQLREYPAQLLELDNKVGDYASKSPDRRDLKSIMEELRDRLELYIDAPVEQDDENLPEIELDEEDETIAKPVSVQEARDAYVATKTAYAEVQHRLTVDQRRVIRAKLVGMNRLVRQAELADAVAHATEHAPAIAHAALASARTAPVRVRTLSAPVPVRPTRGVWSVLGDAFKLK